MKEERGAALFSSHRRNHTGNQANLSSQQTCHVIEEKDTSTGHLQKETTIAVIGEISTRREGRGGYLKRKEMVSFCLVFFALLSTPEVCHNQNQNVVTTGIANNIENDNRESTTHWNK